MNLASPDVPSTAPSLVRVMGRWTLVALTLNSVIGSGIYGVPAETIRLVGTAAPLASVVAAIGMGVVIACFAEVGSQFREAGGMYLYARAAFGSLVGIQTGWMALLVRVSAHAAIASLLVTYIGEFVPWIVEPLPRAIMLTAVLGTLAAVNVAGVSGGARLSNVVTVGKLLPLVIFAVAGVVYAAPRLTSPALDGSAADWTQAVMLLIFAYGGFESALVPMSEAKRPRRDVPFALATSLVVCTALYTAIHIAVLAVPHAIVSPRPVAEAARAFLGPAGASVMAVGAVLSILGILSAGMISTPRLLYSLANDDVLPRPFAWVHPRFRTPWVSVLAYAFASCVLALLGGFVWNAVLSVVGRLLNYGVVCLALLRLRRLYPDADALRLPAGPSLALLGLAFTIVLVVRMRQAEFVVLAAVSLLGLVNWWWTTRTTGPSAMLGTDGSTRPDLNAP